MRKVFVTRMSREEVGQQYPWAEVIVEVDGGWLVFESSDDYREWLQQQ